MWFRTLIRCNFYSLHDTIFSCFYVVLQAKLLTDFYVAVLFILLAKFLGYYDVRVAKKAAALSHCNLIVANYFTSSILGLGLYLRPALAQSLPSTLTISAV